MKAIPFAALALGAGLAGCAGAPASDADRLVNIPLAASRVNAGESAWATLIGRGDKTDATVMASGVPPQVARPIHLYTYIYRGGCGALSGSPAYALTGVVLARSGGASGNMAAPYTVANTADVRLSELRASPHAIVVRSAPADGDLSLFCGEIKARDS